MSDQEKAGPTIKRVCHGCKHYKQEKYNVQGDIGYDAWCLHDKWGHKPKPIPDVDTEAITPDWCPSLNGFASMRPECPKCGDDLEFLLNGVVHCPQCNRADQPELTVDSFMPPAAEAERILRNEVGKDCIWEEGRNLSNASMEDVLRAMLKYAEQERRKAYADGVDFGTKAEYDRLQSEALKREEVAFNAARLDRRDPNVWKSPLYPTFQDYLKTKKDGE